MNLDNFKKWNLDEDDFHQTTYTIKLSETDTEEEVWCEVGVTIRIIPFGIETSCDYMGTVDENRDECYKMLEIILNNYKIGGNYV